MLRWLPPQSWSFADPTIAGEMDGFYERLTGYKTAFLLGILAPVVVLRKCCQRLAKEWELDNGVQGWLRTVGPAALESTLEWCGGISREVSTHHHELCWDHAATPSHPATIE